MDNKTIMEMRPEQRPDEKFLTYGPEVLSDQELLAIIMRTGTAEESAVALADRILHTDREGKDNLLSIFDYEIEDLMKIRGIGRVKAIQIKAIGELSRRIAMTSASKALNFSDPKTIAEYYMERLRHNRKEQVILILLDSSCQKIKDLVISIGTINSALYSPREILIEALRADAVSLILLHNHPSGNPHPSQDDINATKRIRQAGSLIGIPLIDHIIIGDRKYYSFLEERAL